LGAPCWVDLFTSDRDATAAFYHDVFGWTAEPGNPEFGGYSNFSKNGQLIAGCMTNDGTSGAPDMWSTYLAVADARATTAAAESNGATVHVPPMDVGALGTMVLLADPTGASIGMWQPGEHKGFGLIAEPGAPAWFELHTDDYDRALGFYHDVFGWTTYTVSDDPAFRYSTLGHDGDEAAGIMDAATLLPDGVPSNWQVYFNVDSTDDSLAMIEKLGGSTLQPAEDTPYGRMALAADPTGATFKIIAGM
jgi:hypothetical protein